MTLCTCPRCHRSVIFSDQPPLGQPGCIWCLRMDGVEVHLRVVTTEQPELSETAKSMPPGTKVKHLLTEQELLVLELEGDGSTGWFTARDKGMATHRVRYAEVEVVQTASDTPPKHTGYL